MPDEEHLRTLSRTLFLSAFAGGNRISQWQIDRLAPTLDELTVEAGTVLYREGEPAEFVYFMEDGEVELTRASFAPVVMKGKWVIGAMEGSIDLPRTRTAVMQGGTRLVTAPATVWREIFEDHFAMARTAFVGLVRGILGLYERLTNEQLVYNQNVGELADVPLGRLDLVERLLALSAPTATHLAGMQALTALAESSDEIHFENAAAISRSEDNLRGYLLLSGIVVARRKGNQATVTVGPGNFIPIGVLQNPEAWELTSEGAIRALSFRTETMMDELEEHPDLVRSVLSSLWHEREWLLENLTPVGGKIVLR